MKRIGGRRARVLMALGASLVFAVGAFVYLHEDPLPRSRAGDACPIVGSGGLIGFDSATGEVKWTNVVPMESTLETHGGRIHVITQGEPGRLTDRTLDERTGAITRCEVRAGTSEAAAPPRVLDPPVRFRDLTVQRRGDGVVATNSSGADAWVVGKVTPIAFDDAGLVAESYDAEQRPTTKVYDASSGVMQWSARAVLAVTPRPGQSRIFIDEWEGARSSVRITSREPRTGRRRWAIDLARNRHMNVSVRGTRVGNLLVFNTGSGGRITAVDARTGRRLWTADGGSPGHSRDAPDRGDVSQVIGSSHGGTIVVFVPSFDPEKV